VSVGSTLSASTCQLSDGSASTCQDELDRIFGPSIPDFLESVEIYVGKEDIFEKHKNEKIEKTGDHREMNTKSDQDPR
jgi:hypothetical protein